VDNESAGKGYTGMNRYTFTVDNELRISSWNEDAEAITRKQCAEVLGLPYFKVVPRISSGRSDAVTQVLKELTPKTLKGYRVPCFCGSGEADIDLQPVNDVSGMPSGVAVTIDVHPVCNLSEKLKRSQPLIDIGKIASTLAHGVRNPLNAIKGAVVYLRGKYASEKTLIEFTNIMEEEISRLDNFIMKFLSTSIGYTELTETDVNTLLRKLEILTSLQAKAKDIHIEYIYGDTPPVMIDSFHLEQAIFNVVNNAMEAVQPGGYVRIESKPADNSGDFVVVEISDTGPGMAAGCMSDFPLPSGNNAAGKGKGFGLFITRETIKYHGGSLEVKSRKGIGTSITLYLPVSKSEGARDGK
jgi:two-component system, NtrC family, nitrogen regulation sensor histidine kinase GlnL